MSGSRGVAISLAFLRFFPAFLLTLLRLWQRECAFSLLPFQFRQFSLHLDDQHLEFFLAFLAGMGVDVAGVLFAVDPGGRVAALPQVRPLLCDTSGAGSALLARDRLEVGYDGLFALAGGSIPPRLVAVLRRRRLADAAVDVGGGLPLHIVGDVGIDVQRSRRRYMAQHGGEGLDVHAALECQRCKGVAQVVKPHVLAARQLQNAGELPLRHAG